MDSIIPFHYTPFSVQFKPDSGKIRTRQRPRQDTTIMKTLLEISPFANEGAINAAELDSYFRMLGRLQCLIKYTDKFEEYNAADLFGNPGGFTEFVQWKRPFSSNVYGIGHVSFSRREPTDWDTNRLNMNSFRPITYNPELSQSTNYNAFIDSTEGRQFDYVYGLSDDIGMVLFEAVAALDILKDGANFALRIPSGDLDNKLIKDLSFILSGCFTSLYLFPSEMSAEVYLYCHDARESLHRRKVVNLFKPYLDKELTSLIASRSATFDDWFKVKRSSKTRDVYTLLSTWDVPASNFRAEVSDSSGPSEGSKDLIGQNYRALSKFKHLNTFFFNWISGIETLEESINSLAKINNIHPDVIRELLDRRFKPLMSQPPSDPSGSGPDDIVTTVITPLNYSLSMLSNRYRNLIYHKFDVSSLIERYPFFLMECLKLEFRDKLNHLTEAISSPLTNTLDKYYSIYTETTSLGTFSDMVSSLFENPSSYIFVFGNNKKLMNIVWEMLLEIKKNNGEEIFDELYFVMPFWPDDMLVDFISTLGQIKVVTRGDVFSRLDLSPLPMKNEKIIIGYLGRNAAALDLF